MPKIRNNVEKVATPVKEIAKRANHKAWKKGSPEVSTTPRFDLAGVRLTGRGKPSGHSVKGNKLGKVKPAPAKKTRRV